MPTAVTKVFGIGLNKTGTTTLGTCLKRFGYRHLTYRKDLLKAYKRGDLTTVFEVIDHNDSFEDWPYPLMFRELFERYGDTARFILTTRSSPEVWLNSLKGHALRANPLNNSFRLVYGHDYPHGYEAEHIAYYERHNDTVRTYFAQRGCKDLLLQVCWELGHGWAELCAFLNVPVPDAPFPHEYRSDLRIANPKFQAFNERNIAAQVNALARRRAQNS